MSRTSCLSGRYLVQGNVRMVGVRSALGRMEARAVLRLLLRVDDMSPVLYMETVYFASHADPALDRQVGRSFRMSARWVELTRGDGRGGLLNRRVSRTEKRFWQEKRLGVYVRLFSLRPTYQEGVIVIHWSFRSQAFWDEVFFRRSSTFRASGCLGGLETLRWGVCLVPRQVFPLLPLAHLPPNTRLE